MKTPLFLFACLSFYFVVSVLNAQNRVPTHPVDGEYIKEWLVLGPFFPNDLEKDFLADAGGEGDIDPREGDTVTTADGTTLTWKQYQAKGDYIYFNDAIVELENATGYGFCVLQSEVAGDAELHLHHDHGVAVWINGKPVHSNAVGYDEVFDADLKVGTNRCLIKLPQETGFWDFKLRVLRPNRAVISGGITDEKGAVLPNASVRLEQNGAEVTQARTDAFGSYRLNIYPVGGLYDVSATADDRGTWQYGIGLQEGPPVAEPHFESSGKHRGYAADVR